MTGGALAIRGGWAAARNGAILTGILLAVIEAAGIGIARVTAGNSRPQNPPVSELSRDDGVANGVTDSNLVIQLPSESSTVGGVPA